MKNSVNSSLAHRQAVCNLPGVAAVNSLTREFTAAIDSSVMITCAWPGRGMSAVLTRPWRKSLHHQKTAVCDIHSVPYTFFIWLQMSVPLTPSADKNWITARWACLEESMARSLTVISLLFQSTTHRHYRVYTKFLLTYTAIYRRNRKVLPLGITGLQPQSHFHLGMPYIMLESRHKAASVSRLL